MADLPTGLDLLVFVGGGPDEQERAEEHVRSVTLMVKAYTRGRGFIPDFDEVEDDLAAVIISAAARQFSNPEHVVRTEAGSHSEVPGTFRGWTLPEIAVLHRYRRRAA